MQYGDLLLWGWLVDGCWVRKGIHPVLVVSMVRIRRLQKVEFDVLPLVGENSLLELWACYI